VAKVLLNKLILLKYLAGKKIWVACTKVMANQWRCEMKVFPVMIPKGKRNYEKTLKVREWLERGDIKKANLVVNAEKIMTVGGDGTLLHAIADYGGHRKPFFPINCGSKGFLLNSIKSYGEFLDGLYNNVEIKFRLLDVRFIIEGGETVDCKAFNDAYIKADHGKIVSGTIRGEKYLEKDFEGDGIIIATTQGSTAYSRKAGGQVLPLGHDLLAITTICAFPVLAIPEKLQRIEVEIIERYAIGFADHVRVNNVKKMIVEPSDDFVTLLFKKGYDFEAERYRKSI